MGNKGIIKLIVFTLLISAASTAQGRRKAAALKSFGLHSQCETAPASPHEDYGEGDARGDEQQG